MVLQVKTLSGEIVTGEQAMLNLRIDEHMTTIRLSDFEDSKDEYTCMLLPIKVIFSYYASIK